METIVYNGELAYKHSIDGYYATKSGTAISVKVKGGQGKLDYSKPKPLAIKYDKDGYQELCLSYVDNGKHKRKSIKVHQFVWEVFNGNRDLSLTIDHIDGDKLNNNSDNLRQISREENTSIARKGKLTWQKGKKHSHRNIYKTYKNDVYIGDYDKKELGEMFGLKDRDFDKENTKRKTTLNIRIINLVEDTERVG